MKILIPSIGLSDLLPTMIEVACNEGQVLVVDNSAEEHEVSKALGVASLANQSTWMFQAAKGMSLYDVWNQGIAWATESDEPVAILNDDLVLPSGSLTIAAAKLMENRRYKLMGLNFRDPQGTPNAYAPVREVWGTYRTHGFGGFAFVVAPGCPLINPGYTWWYGDDDLAENIKEAGYKLGVAEGAPVDHPHASTSGHQFAWTSEAVDRDYKLYRSLHPKGL